MLYRDPRWREEPEPSGSPHYSHLVLIAVAALVVIGLSAVPFIFGGHAGQRSLASAAYANGVPTEAMLRQDLDVTFGEYTVTGVNDDVAVGGTPVTVTNHGAAPVNATVQIRAVAANGAVLGDDVALVTGLAPGQSFTQNAFTATSDTLSRSLLHATFSVAALSPL